MVKTHLQVYADLKMLLCSLRGPVYQGTDFREPEYLLSCNPLGLVLDNKDVNAAPLRSAVNIAFAKHQALLQPTYTIHVALQNTAVYATIPLLLNPIYQP